MQYIFGKIPHVRMSLYDLKKKKRNNLLKKDIHTFLKEYLIYELKIKQLYVL